MKRDEFRMKWVCFFSSSKSRTFLDSTDCEAATSSWSFSTLVETIIDFISLFMSTLFCSRASIGIIFAGVVAGGGFGVVS